MNSPVTMTPHEIFKRAIETGRYKAGGWMCHAVEAMMDADEISILDGHYALIEIQEFIQRTLKHPILETVKWPGSTTMTALLYIFGVKVMETGGAVDTEKHKWNIGPVYRAVHTFCEDQRTDWAMQMYADWDNRDEGLQKIFDFCRSQLRSVL